MSVLDVLAPRPHCTADGCTRDPLPSKSTCPRHTKSNQTRLSDLTGDAIDALAMSLRAALIEHDYRSVANIAQKILDRTGFGPASSTVNLQIAPTDQWVRYLTDAQLRQIGQWIAEAEARMVASGEVIDVTPSRRLPEPDIESDPAMDASRGSAQTTETEPIAVQTAPVPEPAAPPASDPAPSGEMAPSAAPTCRYCHQLPARCAEIKSTRYDAWEVLHYDDPEIVKKRDEHATKEMVESLRRARMGGDPYIR